MVKDSRIMLVVLILTGVMLIMGCDSGNSAVSAKKDDVVQVHYTGTLEDGTVFDTSVGREPLEFVLGQGKTIAGFEQAILGMKIGESKTVTIAADDAYGQRSDDMILEVNRDNLSGEIIPAVGQQLQTTQPDGSTMVVLITEVSETTITIDANHPLAGKDLTFEIELVSIK